MVVNHGPAGLPELVATLLPDLMWAVANWADKLPVAQYSSNNRDHTGIIVFKKE